jgi:hypothetical protein
MVLTMNVFKSAIASIGLNYVIHLGASWTYSKICTPETMWDIPRSIVATASPICSLNLNLMSITRDNFSVVLLSTVTSAVVSTLRFS